MHRLTEPTTRSLIGRAVDIVVAGNMRTTIELDPDTAKAVEQLRRERGSGMSEAVNELIRRGLLAPELESTFEPVTRPLGLSIDVSNVAETLDLIEGTDARCAG